MSEHMTLVLGGTGKTGRRVARRLRDMGRPVRIGSRTGNPPFDWQEPATWDAALDGAGAVYLAYSPDLAYPGAEEVVGAFAERAAAAGIGRLVLLSGRGEPAAQRCEQVVLGHQPASTVVRAAMFFQNFSEDLLLESVLAGEVAFPGGAVPEGFVDADDIADVAVAALTGDGHAGQIYELTGPRLLTFEEAVAEIAKATGRDVTYVPITPEEWGAALVAAEVPADYAGFLRDLFGWLFDGHNASLSDGVRRALGREPRDFADYAREVAATGIWDAP